jgi:SAM-dependent methyltransferase
MKASKRLGLQIRDRLGPGGRRWAEIGRVTWAMVAGGWSRVPRKCNICGYRGRFYPGGFPSGFQLRMDAGCPACGSLERHRLLKLWLDRNPGAIAGAILHFAPEPSIRRLVEAEGAPYVTADFDRHKDIDRVLDIECIDLPDGSFDTVLCLHVLEHVDDMKALPELFRVLRPRGALLAMVPMVDGWKQTYENAAITSDSDRLLHFGQADHVRYYGADFPDRLRAAGFDVDPFQAHEPDIGNFGLSRGETLFVCRKP